ncbi:hypothetical protein Hdeb2414_s0012g00392631 [Helianthus debilis subsp. tardiflorus]
MIQVSVRQIVRVVARFSLSLGLGFPVKFWFSQQMGSGQWLVNRDVRVKASGRSMRSDLVVVRFGSTR